MKQLIKKLLKGVGNHLVRPHLPLPPDPPDARASASAKAATVGLMLELQTRVRGGLPVPRLSDSGFRVFSQFEEDGYFVFLAAVFELEPKIFLDIGAADGINSNCANLALNLGWHGLFIEADAAKVERGKKFYQSHLDTSLYPPVFKQAFITAENINKLVSEAGLSGNIGVCSIDIDGNDFWVWQALEVVRPAIVIIETHTEFGMNNIVVPYDANYLHPGKHPDYFGASPVAMLKLAHRKGYRLVGANRFGFNLIFASRGVFEDRVPEVSLESVLQHPRYIERLSLFEAVKNFPYVTPEV